MACAGLQQHATSHQPEPVLCPLPLQMQIAALQVGPEYNTHFATLYKFFVAQASLF